MSGFSGIVPRQLGKLDQTRCSLADNELSGEHAFPTFMYVVVSRTCYLPLVHEFTCDTFAEIRRDDVSILTFTKVCSDEGVLPVRYFSVVEATDIGAVFQSTVWACRSLEFLCCIGQFLCQRMAAFSG